MQLIAHTKATPVLALPAPGHATQATLKAWPSTLAIVRKAHTSARRICGNTAMRLPLATAEAAVPASVADCAEAHSYALYGQLRNGRATGCKAVIAARLRAMHTQSNVVIAGYTG